MRPYLPDYRINLIDARNISELERFQTSLQYILGMLKYNSDKDLLYEYVTTHRAEIRSMDSDSAMATLALLGEQKRLAQLMEHKDEAAGEFDMCIAIDIL